mmetsp:Transcript_82925/g.232409  ORF Transcript_82925/g.232409 Transcript_82925/m.232409 type:complete len:180 (+) Transcript_82925:738-1277(+)
MSSTPITPRRTAGWTTATLLRLGPTTYLPWGAAVRRSSGGTSSVYQKASLALTTACDREASQVAEKALSRMRRFCPTCSPSVAIYVLQTTIAGNLLWPPNWHELGLLAWGALGDIPVAAICIAIARRLLRLRDHELVPEVEEFATVLQQELANHGVSPLLTGDWLWEAVDPWSGLCASP